MVVPLLSAPGSQSEPTTESQSPASTSSKTTATASASAAPKISKTSNSGSRMSRLHLTARHDRRILVMALAAGFPGVLVALILLWNGPYPARLQWTLTVLIIGFWFGFSHAVQERVVFPLQTLSNLLAALREGDFSIRARGAARDDALGEAMLEVNFLGQILREQRLGALEATALLRTVMAEIEVAIFAFDGDQKLRLVNRAGERLLAQPAERLTGKSAADPRGLPGRREPRHASEVIPRWGRPVGGTSQHLSRARRAAPVAGALRSEPRAARRRTPGVAAAGSSPRSRA